MTPSHPGAFIRLEVIEVFEFGLNVTAAARILGVGAVWAGRGEATLSDLLNGNASG